MAEIKIPAVEETIEVDRIIGNLEGPEDGPLVIFFGGIHGNEPSGVYALQEVLQEIERDKLELHGSVISISGNLWALEHSQRYETTDLNRLWTRDRVENLRLNGIKYATEDERQQQQLFELIDTVLEGDKGPLYFFDLHTTSAHTAPFITVNDSLLNRRFTKQYPVPLILGIEEYLEGPLLSYINELGYVSFGFEGGQHDSLEAIKNHKVFIYLSLVFAGVLDKSQVPFSDYMHYLQSINPLPGSFYEIYDRHEIQKEERFEMLPGFTNFQQVSQGTVIAKSNGQDLVVEKDSLLFMPLYQNQGDDGFFLIRSIPTVLLWLSALLRKIKVDRIFLLLPGVSWHSSEKEAMSVNLKIARWVARELFHLFGYRSKKYDQNYLLISNRETKSRTPEYRFEDWYDGRFAAK